MTRRLCLLLFCCLACPAQDAPREVDLRGDFAAFGLQPKRQGRRNTCSVCTTTSALEFAWARHRGVGAALSVEYLNWACNQHIGNSEQDRGQFFHHLQAGLEAHGICHDSLMTYGARFTNPQPDSLARADAAALLTEGPVFHWIKPWKKGARGLDQAELEAIFATLDAGWPVAAGASHSLLIVGYRDDAELEGGGEFRVFDSGRGAEGTRSYAFVRKNMCDLFWVEIAGEEQD